MSKYGASYAVSNFASTEEEIFRCFLQMQGTEWKGMNARNC